MKIGQLIVIAGVLSGLQVAAISQPSSTAQTPVVRVNSRLVVVDVTVLDAHHQPVRNLTAADFTLLEAGWPLVVSSFDLHRSSEAAVAVDRQRPAAGVYTNRQPVESRGAVNLLIFDMLNTSASDQLYMLKELQAFLRQQPPTLRMAVYGLSDQLRMWQGFSSDPATLLHFLENGKRLLRPSSLMNDPIGGDRAASARAMTDEMLVGALSDARLKDLAKGKGSMDNEMLRMMAAQLAQMRQTEEEKQALMMRIRVQLTLKGFRQLAQSLETVPGRKNVLWFSSAFPLALLPDEELRFPFHVEENMEPEFRETMAVLAKRQIALYPIDPRGMQVDAGFNASEISHRNPADPHSLQSDGTNAFVHRTGEHAAMEQAAEATGGVAFVNTNDLSKAVAEAVSHGGDYYSLAFVPSRAKRPGEYRKLTVKVNVPGARLAYRRGYYPDRADHEAQAKGVKTEDRFAEAMTHGAPDGVGLEFQATVRPTSGMDEPQAAPGVQLSAKTKGPYRRYAVRFEAAPERFGCPVDAGGLHRCQMQCRVVVFDGAGVQAAMVNKVLAAAMDETKYANFLRGRFVLPVEVSVPAQGEYYLRLGVEDLAGGSVGALELAVDAVSRLRPVAARP